MYRFVDLTDFYWMMTRAEDDEIRARSGGEPTVSPVCAFVDTRTDKFIADAEGHQVCFDAEDVRALDDRDGGRCAGLVPPGFWERKR
jgi:hypothetical protein